jgi:hypothetical protein
MELVTASCMEGKEKAVYSVWQIRKTLTEVMAFDFSSD